jgi:VanZ family protein
MPHHRWGWVVGWALLIEALVLWPSPPEIRSPFAFIGLDKLVHAGLFGVQAVLIARAMGPEARPWWPALAAVMAFGAVTEIEQHFVPTRSMELGDFLADSAGAAIGLAIFAALAPRRRELHR